jgi:hypothetical protein
MDGIDGTLVNWKYCYSGSYLIPPGLGWKHTLCLAWSLHRQEWHSRSWDEVVGCFPPSA